MTVSMPHVHAVSLLVKVHADRADFKFAVVLCFQNHAVIIWSLRMLNFADAEVVHRPMIPPSRA